MSADNTIVILSYLSDRKMIAEHAWEIVPERRVYCVFMASAWEDFDYYQKKQEYNVGHYLSRYIKNSRKFETYEEADVFAESWLKEIEDSGGYVEYGITEEETDYLLLD